MNNIYVLNKNYSKIGTLSNQGARPQAPYYEDLFVQELETGADTYQFSTISSPYTQDILEIGNHIMFTYKNRNELFTITSLEYSHNEGYKTIGVYAEGIGFDLLEVYMKRPENEKESSSGGSGSGGSGGSSSGGGRDEDNDGDDNTDDEYADVDDVYVDENGIIIYDKYGQDDYADPDNVSVDENGVIIYRRNKRNRKKDSLEFKNISYSRFLSILLKNTGWSYVCQPGLESVKHDITVRYDTNIFALLQDSMQSYRGVELEFVHELVGGRVQKVIKAYKDGGRGSFVGKRFEYGKNVRGITKTQEVTDSEDDTILYVDNVGINVQYDVDFALKSAEVPEIEIGDTHYVIDKDFYPPMTIKARIGKIEISFSDPTVNKIYLANNKRISGSAIEDEFNEDDIKDIIDDYDPDDPDDPGDNIVTDHDHNRLVDNGTVFQLHGYSEEDGLFFPAVTIDYTLDDSTLVSENIFTDHQALISAYPGYHIGSEDCPWGRLYASSSYCDETVSEEIRGSHLEAGAFFHLADNAVMENMDSISDSSDITKQDMYDFIVNEVKLYSYDFVNNLSPHFFGDYTRINNMIGVSARDLCSTEIGNKWFCTRAYGYDPDGDGGGTLEYVCNLSNMIYMLLGAFQQHVSGSGSTPGSGSGNGPSFDGDDSIQIGGVIQATEVIGNDAMYTTKLAVFPWSGGNPEILVTRGNGYDVNAEGTRITPDGITFPDGTTLTTANGSGGSSGSGSYGDITCDTLTVSTLAKAGFVETGRLEVGLRAEIKELSVFEGMTASFIEVGIIKFPDGSTLSTANGSGGGGTPSNPGTGGGNVFDTITVRKIQGPDPGEGQYNRVEFEDAICVNHIWSADEDGIIQMQDELVLNNGLELYGDLEVEDGIIYAKEVRALKFTNLDGSEITPDGSAGGNSSTDNITASKITIGTPTDSKVSKCTLAVKGNTLVEGNLYIEGGNGLYVNGTPGSDKSLKENIRYVDNTGTIIVDKENLETRDYHNEDLLEKTDLHDFIVNQVNICEYNFIGKDRNKIGFIANEYEGTKVGDKIVSRDKELDLLFYDSDNLLFATIGALQEEVRTKDEKIASLEARLAKIEAMLGINNNDN